MIRTSFALLLAVATVATAAPPKIDIPAEVRPSGQYVDFDPATDAVSVTYVGLSGVEPVPPNRLSDKRAFLMDTRGLEPGEYAFVAVAASKTGEQTRVRFVVAIGARPKPPGPDPRPKPDPEPSPARTAARLWLVVIEDTAKRTPEQGKAVSSPDLRKWVESGGHELEIVSSKDSAIDANGYGPYIKTVSAPAVLLVMDRDQPGPQVPLAVVPLPSTADGIKGEASKWLKKN